MSLLAHDAARSAQSEDDVQFEAAVPMSIDEYLIAIGEFGRYQQRHYALVAGAWLPIGLTTLSMVFINARPRWLRDGVQFAGPPPCNATVVLVDQTVGGEFGLICDDAVLRADLNTLYFAGFLCGASILGWFSDRHGRRKACCVACALASVSTFCSALAPTYAVYALCRAIAGIGVGGLATSCYVLATEFIGPSWQSVTGNAQSAIFAVGGVLLAPLALLLPSWRLLAAACALPTALWFFVFLLVVPESPRWLLAHDQAEKAAALLFAVAVVNGTAPAGGAPALLGASATGAPGVRALFRHAVMRRRTLAMLYCWFAVSFAYYGLSLNAGNLQGSLHLNFAVSCAVEVPACLLAGRLCDRIGRKRSLSFCFGLAGVLCLACIVLPPGFPTTAAATIGKFAIAGAFATVFVYATELFPTVLRNGAMGLSSSAARCGGMVAPLAVLLAEFGVALPLVVFGAVAVIASACALLLPETKGRPLPETLAECVAPPTGAVAAAHSEGAAVEMAPARSLPPETI